jgi:PAS domain S-box-containing protein
MDNKSIPDQIRDILKTNSRGMTVGEIARSIGMNAQSMGRHLDVLAASGNLEVRTFGRSKVYYLSQRVPIFSLIDISQDMILILDKDLRITNVNKKFDEFTGIKREKVLNKSINDAAFPIRFSPDIAPHSMRALEGEHFRIDALFKRGEMDLYFRIKFIPMLYDSSDKGVILIFEDITARKKIEAQRSFLAAIVDSSYDAIIGKTLDGEITSWNKSAERIYGYTAAEMIGNNISLLVPPERQEEVAALLRKVRNCERIEHHETERVRKNGERITVSLTLSPIVDDSGNVLGASTIAYETRGRNIDDRSIKSTYSHLKMLLHSLFWPAVFYASASLCF